MIFMKKLVFEENMIILFDIILFINDTTLQLILGFTSTYGQANRKSLSKNRYQRKVALSSIIIA